MPPRHLAAPAAVLLASPALAAPEVHDARLYLAFGAATSGAARMVVENPGGPDDRLPGVAPPAARTVALHGSEEEDGLVRMAEVEGGPPLPADGAVELAPGGFHVMLMRPDDPLAPGDAVPRTLRLEAGPLEITLPVEVEGGAPASGRRHGH